MTRLAVLAVLALAACAAVNSAQTGKPLDPAQVNADVDTAAYLLKATGCLSASAAAVAAPIVTIAGDAQGQQVLTASSGAGAALCTMVVPPSALPVPAPANAPPVAAAIKP